ncbi:MAG: ferritin family protein [Polyangiaceae bacterium]
MTSGKVVLALAGASPEDLEAAQLAWANRVMAERHGAVVLTALLALMLESAAPHDVCEAVALVVRDELRHARRCEEIFRALDGPARFELDLGADPIDRPASSAATAALLLVERELVCVEAQAVVVLSAYVATTTEPAMRRVFGSLLRDERRHTNLGAMLLARLTAHFAPRDVAAFELGRAERCAGITAQLERQARARATGGPGRGLGAGLLASDLEFGSV